jgi:hypothetical protein
MRALVPIVMAGIIGIYGLVVSVVIAGKITSKDYGWKECVSVDFFVSEFHNIQRLLAPVGRIGMWRL